MKQFELRIEGGNTSSTYEWDKCLVTRECDIDENSNSTTLDVHQMFAMLRALPLGVRWNPYEEQFEKVS